MSLSTISLNVVSNRFYYESICCLDDLLAVAFYYLNARNLLTSGHLHCSPTQFYQLVALVLQAGTGDFIDIATTRLLVDKLSLVPTIIKLKSTSVEDIIAAIASQHSSLSGMFTFSLHETETLNIRSHVTGCSSGTALVRFMDIAQKLPVYGVHLYFVKDKASSPTVLGICSRGILEYANGADLCGAPTYFYEWEQLENLFHRDHKFTIEFHQSRTLPSTASLQNGAKPRVPVTPSTGHRATTRSWTTPSELVAQSIWYNAVQQHNFYLSREGNRRTLNPLPTLPTIAASVDLDREVSSRLLLKPINSPPLPSKKMDHTNVENLKSEPEKTPKPERQSKIPPGVDVEKLKHYLNLRQKRNVLRESLAMKRQLLRDVCMQEAKLTGELPSEYPLAPGEDRPLLVPTSYTLSTRLLGNSPSAQNVNTNTKTVPTQNSGIQLQDNYATIVELESQIELHRQIVNAKLRLAQDKGQPRKIRNQRMKDYQESLNRVTVLEEQLRTAYHQQQQKLQIRQPFARRNIQPVAELIAKEASSPLSSLSSSGIGGGISTPSVGSIALSKAKSLQDCRRLSDGSASLGGSALSLHQQQEQQVPPPQSSQQLATALVSGVPKSDNYDQLYNAFSHSRQTYRSFTAGSEFASSPSEYPPSRINSYDTVIPSVNQNGRMFHGSNAITKSIDSGFHDAGPVANSNDYLTRPALSPVMSTPRTANSTPGSPLRCTCGTGSSNATPKQRCFQQCGNSRGQLYSVQENSTDQTTPAMCVTRKPYKSETSLNRSFLGDAQQTPTNNGDQFVATRAPQYTVPFTPSNEQVMNDDGDSPRDGAAPVRVYARSPWTAKAYVSPRRYNGQQQPQTQHNTQHWGANSDQNSIMTPRQFNRANTVAVPEYALHSATSSSSSLSSFAVNSQLATDFSSEMLQWYEEYLPSSNNKQTQRPNGQQSSANHQPTFV